MARGTKLNLNTLVHAKGAMRCLVNYSIFRFPLLANWLLQFKNNRYP